MISLSLTLHRLGLYGRLVRLDRPIGTVLLACPALWALWAATAGAPVWSDLAIVLLCAFLTRSAGCAVNDWSDRSFDRSVARTRHRPLAAGQLRPPEALVIAVVLMSLALVLSFWLSYSVLWLLPPVAALIVFYPFTKRFFVLPQLVLALTFSMAVPVSWYASVGQFTHECWLLMVISIVWVFSYDTIYALSDVNDDRAVGIHSSALFFGGHAQAAVGLFHALLVLGLWLFGNALELGWHWYLILLAALISIAYQHYLIARARDGDFMRAFVHNGWFGFVVWLGLVIEWL